jgi:hypothetical protein
MNPAGSFNSFFDLFLNFPQDVEIFWMVIAFMFMVGFLLYALFSILVVRQVYMMTKTFKTTAEPVLKILSFLHLIFAFSIMVVSYLILF